MIFIIVRIFWNEEFLTLNTSHELWYTPKGPAKVGVANKRIKEKEK